MGLRPRSERCDIGSRLPLALCVCLTRRPQPRWSSTGLLRRLRELEIVRRIPDSVGSSPALRGMRPDLNITTVRHFLHWPHRALSWTGSHAERHQSPFSPMRTNGPFLPGLRMTRPCQTRQWAILSLLPRTAAPFLSGAPAERAAFSPLALVAAQSAPSPTTPLAKPSRGGDRQRDDVVTQW
jgi:hypothetical protein